MNYQPILDPDYLPMLEFERQYQSKAGQSKASEQLNCVLTLLKNPQQVARQQTMISLAPQLEAQTLSYLNRFVKSMLWLYGGYQLYANLPQELLSKLQKIFLGEQKFDAEFIVEGILSANWK